MQAGRNVTWHIRAAELVERTRVEDEQEAAVTLTAEHDGEDDIWAGEARGRCDLRGGSLSARSACLDPAGALAARAYA